MKTQKPVCENEEIKETEKSHEDSNNSNELYENSNKRLLLEENK